MSKIILINFENVRTKNITLKKLTNSIPYIIFCIVLEKNNHF